MYAHGMLKVPYECLSLESRRLQKKVEKVVSNSIAVTNGLSNKIREKEEKVPSAPSDGKPADVNWDKVVGNLEKVKNMLQATKKKLSESNRYNNRIVCKCEKRLSFIKDRNREKETMVLIADHLLRHGYRDSAKLIAERSNVAEIVDDVVLENVHHVSMQLRDQNLEPALKWCMDRKSRLKKMNSSLEFELHRIAFLQLVRSGKHEEAVYYAKKHLAQHKNDRFEAIKKTMAKLAVSTRREQKDEEEDEDMEVSERSLKRKRYAKNFAEVDERIERKDKILPSYLWEEIATLFENESSRMLSLSQQSTLQIFLQIGLSSLKTRSCATHSRKYKKNKVLKPAAGAKSGESGEENQSKKLLLQNEFASVNCPACCEDFAEIVKNVPYSHYARSQLVCRVSGEVMDENNPPMALTNGQVYSMNAIRKMIKTSPGQKDYLKFPEDSIVKCPLTGNECRFNELKKVFVL